MSDRTILTPYFLDEPDPAIAALAATDRVVAVSLSLWEPSLDPDGQTQAVVQGAINALLGR